MSFIGLICLIVRRNQVGLVFRFVNILLSCMVGGFGLRVKALEKEQSFILPSESVKKKTFNMVSDILR